MSINKVKNTHKMQTNFMIKMIHNIFCRVQGPRVKIILHYKLIKKNYTHKIKSIFNASKKTTKAGGGELYLSLSHVFSLDLELNSYYFIFTFFFLTF